MGRKVSTGDVVMYQANMTTQRAAIVTEVRPVLKDGHEVLCLAILTTQDMTFKVDVPYAVAKQDGTCKEGHWTFKE